MTIIKNVIIDTKINFNDDHIVQIIDKNFDLIKSS